LCLSILKIFSVFAVSSPKGLNTTLCNEVHSVSFQRQILGKPGNMFIRSAGKHHQFLNISWRYYSCEFCDSDRRFVEDSSLLGCYTMPTVEKLKTFRSFAVIFTLVVKQCSWQTAWL